MKHVYKLLAGLLLSAGSTMAANVIPNGSFGNGIAGWTAANGGSDCCVWNQTDGNTAAGCMQITNATAAPDAVWSTQIQGKFITTLQTGNCTVSFYIKCKSGTGSMRCSIAGTAHYQADQTVTTTYQKVSWTFAAKGGETALCLDMGKMVNTYYIDDVEVNYSKASFGCTPDLHVDGKNLKDPQGNTVVLHGVMDTPSPYFNNHRWGYSCNSSTVAPCKAYFNKLFTAITDTAQGAYCNLFRLHMDPCWTNADGKSTTGESDISAFDESKLNTYLPQLYIPLAQEANSHGLYVIMRPPGVCPQSIQVGGDYYNYLMKVWNAVSSNATVKASAGWLSLELANEPVTCLDANGKSGANALHDFFQPIVDMIRKNGFTGILWIPGTGWQSQYGSYSTYPITGDNIGYAVHVYPGWYNNNDDNCSASSFIKQFATQVPVVTSKPVVITECDWSPGTPVKDANGNYEYQTDGTIKTTNLGTWGTASTSKWGAAFKSMMDYYGNISLNTTGTSDYIDIDTFLNIGKVVAAFNANPEACGKATMDWYKEYAKVNTPACGGSVDVNLTSTDDTIMAGESVTLNVTALAAANNITQVSIYEGDVLLTTLSSYPYTYTLKNIAGGKHSFSAVAVDDAANIGRSATLTVVARVPQSPYKGIVANIPGTIQVEDYDYGDEGLAYHDADSTNNDGAYRNDGVDIKGNSTDGYRIGWTVAGEWIEYTVNVAKTGTYKWSARVASENSSSAFHLMMDGKNITSMTKATNTGSWDTFTTVGGTTSEISAGEHVLRLAIDSSYFDIDWMKFDAVEASGITDIASAVNPQGLETGRYIVYNMLGMNIGQVNLSADENIETALMRLTSAQGVYVLKAANSAKAYRILIR